MYLLEWPVFRSLITPNADKDIELLFIAGENS